MIRKLVLNVKSFFRRRRVRTAQIKALLREKNLLQKDLAVRIGYTPEHFNNIIHNRREIKLNPQKAPALAEILGVPLSEVTRLFGLRSIPTNLGDDGFEPSASCL